MVRVWPEVPPVVWGGMVPTTARPTSERTAKPSAGNQRCELSASRPGVVRPAAAGLCGSGLEIQIGSSARCPALVPPGQLCAGVFRKLVTRVWA